MDDGFNPAAKVTGLRNKPVPEPRRIATVLLAALVTTRSSRPSPLTSRINRELGLFPPVGKLLGAPNVPLPALNITLTLPGAARFVTARSKTPSPLKSSLTTSEGDAPARKD